MKRRGFLGLVAGAAVWPLAAPAQQGGGMRRLGVLAGYAANDVRSSACRDDADIDPR